MNTLFSALDCKIYIVDCLSRLDNEDKQRRDSEWQDGHGFTEILTELDNLELDNSQEGDEEASGRVQPLHISEFAL